MTLTLRRLIQTRLWTGKAHSAATSAQASLSVYQAGFDPHMAEVSSESVVPVERCSRAKRDKGPRGNWVLRPPSPAVVTGVLILTAAACYAKRRPLE